MRIAFIGAGRMAEALIARFPGSFKVTASDVNPERLRSLRRKYGINVVRDNREAFASAPVVVLAVKPQNMAEVLEGLGGGKTVISIAAGIPLGYLQKKLPGASIIRAMPGRGITAISKNSKIARMIFEPLGEVVAVPEKWMDAVTGLSGSGPAFVFLMIEALAEGGVRAGLPRKIAEKLALQTVAGAAETVKITGRTPKELCEMVASPGGTTVEGLKVLEQFKASRAFSLAVQAAAKKSKVISKKWAF